MCITSNKYGIRFWGATKDFHLIILKITKDLSIRHIQKETATLGLTFFVPPIFVENTTRNYFDKLGKVIE